MHSITCIIQAFDATADTCSVELAGIGIIDAWIDGVAIAPTVDRAFIVGGAPGVITMPDINRPCDATLIQVTPPGTPVSYNPDQIVVYTGSLSIPTDSSGAGCQNVVFPTPYSTTPLVSASAAHPASVTISNITESGFTACVTGGKVSSRHSVSYSAKSSNTSTATKNKALTVDHNEVDVGTHYILDFKDGDVVWTVTDHSSGPARNQVEATLSDAFKATLGSGAGGGFHGISLLLDSLDSNLSGNFLYDGTHAPGTRFTDSVIPFTVEWDTDHYAVNLDGSGNYPVTIPAGLGGKYLLLWEFEWELSAPATQLGTDGLSFQFDPDDGEGRLLDFSEIITDGDVGGSNGFTSGQTEGTAQFARVITLADAARIHQPLLTLSTGYEITGWMRLQLVKLANSVNAATSHQAKAHAGTTGNTAALGNWLGDAAVSPTVPLVISNTNYLDTLDWDTDSYWDPVNHWFTVPTGLGGTYEITEKVRVTLTVDTGVSGKGWSVGLTDFGAAIGDEDRFTAAADSNGSGNFTAGVNEVTLTFVRVAQLADGDQVIPRFSAGSDWHMKSDYADCSLVKLS